VHRCTVRDSLVPLARAAVHRVAMPSSPEGHLRAFLPSSASSRPRHSWRTPWCSAGARRRPGAAPVLNGATQRRFPVAPLLAAVAPPHPALPPATRHRQPLAQVLGHRIPDLRSRSVGPPGQSSPYRSTATRARFRSRPPDLDPMDQFRPISLTARFCK
jgi:hypothetical protein